LYQRTKASMLATASSMSAKRRMGWSGRYFSVLKSDSMKGLSSLTAGRLNEGVTPREVIIASIVAPFMAAPLSEWRTMPSVSTPSWWQVASRSWAASFSHSRSCTAHPTILRLHTSTNT
jgi:hypothetical protein